MTRLLTAALLIPAAWYLSKRAPFPVFLAALLLVAAGAAWECCGILRHRGARPFAIAATAAAAAAAGAFATPFPYEALAALFAGLVFGVPVLSMARRGDPGEMLDAVQATVFPALFIGLPLAFAGALRAVPGETGPDLLLLLLLCVTLADTGAYYAGSRLGRHRMAPSISPKKSWEGAAGGLAGSVVGALVAHAWFFQKLPVRHALAIAALLCAAGIAGDLAESMLKRAGGVKDSSGLLPGHGGLLDRMDSLLAGAPILYYYWRLALDGTF